MRLIDARELLEAPLKFGDARQIQARSFIAKFDDAMRCLEIDGFSHVCGACNGRGVLANGHRKGTSCYHCGGIGAQRATKLYIEMCDEEELEGIIGDLRELGMFENAG